MGLWFSSAVFALSEKPIRSARLYMAPATGSPTSMSSTLRNTDITQNMLSRHQPLRLVNSNSVSLLALIHDFDLLVIGWLSVIFDQVPHFIPQSKLLIHKQLV